MLKVKEFIMFLLLVWNSITASFSRVAALLLGGFLVGFMKGLNDLKNMNTYFEFKAKMLEKQRKEKEGE